MRGSVPGLRVALAFMAGVCLGLSMPPSSIADACVDTALVTTPVLACASWIARHRSCAGWWTLLLAVSCVGVVHGGMESQRSPSHAVIAAPSDAPLLVRMRAILVEDFRAPDPAAMDALDRFQVATAAPSWRAKASLVSVSDTDSWHAACGTVTLRVPVAADHLLPGDLIEGVGWLQPPTEPENPGQGDMRLHAWRRNWVGQVMMESPPIRLESAGWFQWWRFHLQRWVDRNLVRGMPGAGADDVSTLVVAMTTGRQRMGYASLRAVFSSTGLTHFLAISGFNVAVLFGAAMVTMELVRVPGSMRGWALVLVGLVFLLVVDIEVSVLRAGVTGVMAGAALAMGRGWRADGLLAAACMATLIADPWMAFHAGFQLSYGAVLALRYGSGPMDRVLQACRMPAWGGVRLACAASLAAWMVSMPVTMAHFGSVSPWCAPASTLLGPLAAVLTVTASFTAALGWIPGLHLLLGPVLWCMGWLFLWCVRGVGWLPGADMMLEPWPWWWAVMALVLLVVIWTEPMRERTRRALALALLAWMSLPWLMPRATTEAPDPSCIRWTMLSIGDGSAHLIEHAGQGILFDAGSISRQGMGSSVIVPALRAMGVERLHAVVVSHPHLDHYAALPEVLAAFPVDQVVLTQSWQGAGPTSAAGTLVEIVNAMGVPHRSMVAGERIEQGPLRWECLHPPDGFRPTVTNDGSLVFRIMHPVWPDRPTLLLLGDAQDQAIAPLLGRLDIRQPWVMELPHHGGWRPIAGELCAWVRPAHVMQSTARKRFQRDRFMDVLAGVPRAVTCRDHAARVTVDPRHPDRPVRMERWSGNRWLPLSHPSSDG
jgi:competence protein ComEC